MKILNSVILIEQQNRSSNKSYRFNYTNAINISSSWDMFTDTASITLPNTFRDLNNKIIDNSSNENTLFRRGDKISIWVAYSPDLILDNNGYPTNTPDFKGYISKVKPDSPMVLECEDEMWLLKQNTVEKYSKKSVTLETLISDNIKDADGNNIVEFSTIDATLGAFKIQNVTIVDVLQEIKKTYGLLSWFRQGVLNIGLPFTASEAVTHTFYFNGNSANIIEDDLEYIRLDDVSIVLKGISMKPDNSKIERYAFYNKVISSGELTYDLVTSSIAKQGEQRTLHYYNLSQSDLDETLERELPNYFYEGYRGTFTAFGIPKVKHGDYAKLIDLRYPERNGTYAIKTVNTSFGVDGFKQNIEIDRRTDG